jgi:RimJ/RimL family protein N-acetyltransferase
MTLTFNPKPVTLEGRHVRLEPMAAHHAPPLFEAGRDPRIWEFLSDGPFDTLEAMGEYVSRVLDRAAAGDVPFAIIHRASGRAIGSTRYFDIQRAHRGLEIGHTWLSSAYWRTPANTECKHLLLCHAFETLGAIRVQLKTDLRNERSQAAIARLGAVREGVLRNHMIVKDGRYRHTVMFSITDDEWPEVKAGLEAKLAQEPGG